MANSIPKQDRAEVSITIEVKDPDLLGKLEDAGMQAPALAHIEDKALFHEYFTFKLDFSLKTGRVVKCTQVKNR
jgi:hypothetical protein